MGGNQKERRNSFIRGKGFGNEKKGNFHFFKKRKTKEPENGKRKKKDRMVWSSGQMDQPKTQRAT